MKIEIDLNEILRDEYGTETFEESVRREVLDTLSVRILKNVQTEMDETVDAVIQAELKANIELRMPEMLQMIFETEYVPVDTYGSKKPPTTVRQELVKAFSEKMTYTKKTYDSDKNEFSRMLDAVVADKVKEFKASFNKTIDAQFTQECFAYATEKLKQKLGIKE